MFVGAAVRISDPSGIIYQAIWLYLRFTLSFRDIEDLLAQRGIAVSYETVPRWVNRYTPDKNLAIAHPSNHSITMLHQRLGRNI
jgi:transposase-like protein